VKKKNPKNDKYNGFTESIKKGKYKNVFKVFLIVFIVFIIIGAIGYKLFTTNQNFDAKSVLFTNISDNSFTIFWETDIPTYTKVKLISDNSFKNRDWVNDDLDSEKPIKRKLHHVTFSELMPDQRYEVKIANTLVPLNLLDFYKDDISTEKIDEKTTDIPDVVYGTVKNSAGENIKGGIVFLSIDEDEYVSTPINDDSTYSLDISSLDKPENGFLEKITVLSEDYQKTEFIAQSEQDRPVPDIILSTEGGSNVNSRNSNTTNSNNNYTNNAVDNNGSVKDRFVSFIQTPRHAKLGILDNLVTEVEARNSCFQNGEIGGVRIQCDTDIDWMKEVNLNNCPQPDKFRVGLVAHKTKTFLYDPSNIRLKIVEVNEESEAEQVVLTGIPNGDYIEVTEEEDEMYLIDYNDQEYEVEKGQSFKVIAYNQSSGKVCSEAKNIDSETYIKFLDKTETYDPPENGNDDEGDGDDEEDDPGGGSGVCRCSGEVKGCGCGTFMGQEMCDCRTKGASTEFNSSQSECTDSRCRNKLQSEAQAGCDQDDRCKSVEVVSASSSWGGTGGIGGESLKSSGYAGTMRTILPADQPCKKIGENYASFVPISEQFYKDSARLGMSWGKTLIVSNESLVNGEWEENVTKAGKYGITTILGICQNEICDINDGKEYGQSIAELYKNLLHSGNLPSNGLYVQIGHNEPNSNQYRDPNTEGEFVKNTIESIQKSDIPISHNPNDAGIKLISPTLDLTVLETNKSEKRITPEDYLKEMQEYYKDVEGELYAVALKGFYEQNNEKIIDLKKEINDFINFIESEEQIPDDVLITGIGKKVDNNVMSWKEFGQEINDLDDIENIRSILLFNSLGVNRGDNYKFHEGLWNDPNLIKGNIIKGCKLDSVRISQENTYTEELIRKFKQDREEGIIPVLSKRIDSGLYCGNFECDFRKWFGKDEVMLPQGWYPWWDEKIQLGEDGNKYCGDFKNSGEEFYCKRPKYKQVATQDIATNLQTGSSLQISIEKQTYNAGIFSIVHIGDPGEEKEIEFSAKALALNDSEDNVYHGQVGIHPHGAIDRNKVIWGDKVILDPKSQGDEISWKKLNVKAKVQSGVITVFLRSNNKWALPSNDSYWDDVNLLVNGKQINSDNLKKRFVDDSKTANTKTNDRREAKKNNQVVLVDSNAEESSYAHPELPLDEVEESGKYLVKSERNHVLLPYVNKYEGEDVEAKFFYDENMNLKYDEGEEFAEDMGDIKVQKVSDIVKYELHEGFNFISFPLVTEDITQASDFLNEVKQSGGYAPSISSFYSGYWIPYSNIGGYDYGTNFNLIGGRGYIVQVKEPTTVVIEGSRYAEPVSFDLLKGWNLVGVHGVKNTYTAETLVEKVRAKEDFEVDNITTWVEDEQRYKGYFMDEDTGEYFGNDYSIDASKSYFMRLTKGEGLVKP
jgi:hypothetical protein